MKAKTVFSTALLWTALCLGAVRGQTPSGSMNSLHSLSASGQQVETAGPAQAATSVAMQPSAWIRGDKYHCCDGVGGSGPIDTELFFRTGPAVPISVGQMASVLQTGLYLGAGARALFFEPSLEAAWTVELGIANISNHAHKGSLPIQLSILVPSTSGNPPPVLVPIGVSVQSLSRTFFDVGIGREWYLAGNAGSEGTMWRVGFDAGARYGSSSATFHEIKHRTDVIGGTWAALHSDVEIPCGCCVLQAGFRVEWGYTWSDILQIQNDSDVQDVNFLFTVGIRY